VAAVDRRGGAVVAVLGLAMRDTIGRARSGGAGVCCFFRPVRRLGDLRAVTGDDRLGHRAAARARDARVWVPAVQGSARAGEARRRRSISYSDEGAKFVFATCADKPESIV